LDRKSWVVTVDALSPKTQIFSFSSFKKNGGKKEEKQVKKNQKKKNRCPQSDLNHKKKVLQT